MSTPRQQCLKQAKHYLSGLGTLKEIKAYRQHGFYHVVFRLTRHDCVETYVSDGTGASMTKTHTAPTEPLPLFKQAGEP